MCQLAHVAHGVEVFRLVKFSGEQSRFPRRVIDLAVLRQRTRSTYEKDGFVGAAAAFRVTAHVCWIGALQSRTHRVHIAFADANAQALDVASSAVGSVGVYDHIGTDVDTFAGHVTVE